MSDETISREAISDGGESHAIFRDQGSDAEEAGPRRIRLVSGGALRFDENGFRLIEPRGLKRSPIHAYDTLTHVYVTDRALLIATQRDLLTVRRQDFVDPEHGPETAYASMLEHVGRSEEGPAILARIAMADRVGEREGTLWAVWATVFLCLAGTAIQIARPMFEQVGSFLPELVARGEYWRAVTFHFLHDLSPTPWWLAPFAFGLPIVPFHLAVNVAGLLILGRLVERPLGTARTAIVLGLAGIGSVLGILMEGHLIVLGASGLVSGLAGAMLALEFHHAEEMPSFWRLPRRLFLLAIFLQFGVLDQLLGNYVAGGAHLGGFAGGYAATWLVGRAGLAQEESSLSHRFAGACAAALVVIGFAGAMPLAQRDMQALERHALRLYDIPNARYLFRYDNAAAWFIATEEGASQQALELAVALADRAVRNTGRLVPDVLDTLAEALFQYGDVVAAVFTIDEAIRLAPNQPYFREQRKRFTGERDPNDRPPPPGTDAPGLLPPDIEPDELLIDPSAPRTTA